MILAFEKFNKENPDYLLVLAGKRGKGFKKTWNELSKMGALKNVIAPGYVTEDEKSALYSMAKAVFYPSLDEGFGFPILEAFNFEVPVVSSKISVIEEVAGDAALLVDPFNVVEMAKGLRKVVSNKKIQKEYVDKGRERLKKFSWEKSAKRTLEIIKSFK